jgi:hypothetical protein
LKSFTFLYVDDVCTSLKTPVGLHGLLQGEFTFYSRVPLHTKNELKASNQLVCVLNKVIGFSEIICSVDVHVGSSLAIMVEVVFQNDSRSSPDDTYDNKHQSHITKE